MLSDSHYAKILSYFDRQFWSGKTDETNWHYYGIILDWYFDNSVFCVDYLDVADYFSSNGGFSFSETELFSKQYAAIEGQKRLDLIQAVLNLIKISTVNTEQSKHIISVITNVLTRDAVTVIVPESGPISIKSNDILDSGSYCNIILIKMEYCGRSCELSIKMIQNCKKECSMSMKIWPSCLDAHKFSMSLVMTKRLTLI